MIARTIRNVIAGGLGISLALVLMLRWVPPPTSAFMLRTVVESSLKAGELRAVEFRWTPLDRISANLKLAVIAAEDQRFSTHNGFDWQALAANWKRNQARHRAVAGGSTLTQQTAKNLFLYREKTWLRKGLETYFTVLLEACWPKPRILEVYLNVAQFGPDVFGAESASRTYFAKHAQDLTEHEAALLAAVLPNPIKRAVAKPTVALVKRRDHVLNQMRALGGQSYLKKSGL